MRQRFAAVITVWLALFTLGFGRAVLAQTTIFDNDFTNSGTFPNGASIGSNWLDVAGSSWDVSGNKVNALTNTYKTKWLLETLSQPRDSEIVLTSAWTSNSTPAGILRASYAGSLGTAAYVCFLSYANGTFTIQRLYSSGSATTITTATPGAGSFVTGHNYIISFTASGASPTSLSATVADAASPMTNISTLSASDSSGPQSNGYIGLSAGGTAPTLFTHATGYNIATLSSGVLSLGTLGSTTIQMNWTAASGGTSPYTYTLNRSTSSSMSSPTAVLSGSSLLTYTDTPPLTGVNYWYQLTSTDSASNSTTSNIVGPEAAGASVTVTSPASYQVIQRSGTTGTITVTGHVTGTHAIAANFTLGPPGTTPGTFATITGSITNANYSGTLTACPQGQGVLTVETADGSGNVVTINYVGVGDVFVIAGQSNAVGHGLNNQVQPAYFFAPSGFYQATEGSTSGTWLQIADPIGSDYDGLGTSGAQRGTYWVLLASEMTSVLGVPVAFVPTAISGTSSAQWLPSVGAGGLFAFSIATAEAASPSGYKAVLWHQGEADATTATATPQSTYVANIAAIAAGFEANLGCPMVICKLQTPNPSVAATYTNYPAIQAGIAQEWANDSNIVEGPDLSVIVDDNLSIAGIHISSDGQLKQAADLWWAALSQYLYKIGVTSGGSGGAGVRRIH